jgi:hypothetical protein
MHLRCGGLEALERRLKAVEVKKTAVLAFNLIIVIAVAVLWVLQGHDYVIGFIIAAGFVGFVGIPLYNRYAKQESQIRSEMQQANVEI